jgi:ABC-type phosphate transport system substrate-binding protein
VLVFLGTLLGSLFGIAADAGGAADTFERFKSLFYPELCIAGSNTILGEGIQMAVDWKNQFEREKEARVSIYGVGSVRGVERAIIGDCVHVLAMSEPMTIAQYNALRGANVEIDCAAEIGYDVVAFVTDIDNRLPALLERNLRSILLGQIKDWQTVGGAPSPIRLLARPGSGTTEVVLRNVTGWLDDNLNDNQYFPPGTNYIPCPTNDACLDATLATPGSLYWVSMAWMRTQPERFLRVMPILRGDERPINPLTEQIDLNAYPSSLIRPMYMYVLKSQAVPDEIEQLAREFLYFVRSVRGQTIVERHHFYAFFNRPRGVRVDFPPGFEPDDTGLRPVCRS